MSVKSTQLGKALLAEVTLIGPLASVRAHVISKRGLLGKRFSTKLA